MKRADIQESVSTLFQAYFDWTAADAYSNSIRSDEAKEASMEIARQEVAKLLTNLLSNVNDLAAWARQNTEHFDGT
jgi:hypothetical protein